MNLQDAGNMMNQGASTNTITALDQNSLEARQVTDSSQGYVGSYYTPSVDGRTLGNSNYLQDQRADLPTRNVQDGSGVTSLATSSSSAPVNVPQEYSSYTTYSNTDPYGYGNTSHAGYYSGYQQQSTQPYPQPVGAYQNTGAPYQPISSFQNTGSYAGPASYSSTYYNPGHYQTSGGHASSGYSSQTNSWNQGNYAPYASQQYPNYTSDANGAYNASSVSATTSLQYEQHYKQWADYYSQTEVSCAPGTENVSAASTSNPLCSVPSTGIHPGSYSLPPAPLPPAPLPPAPSISSWRPESNLSELPSVQNGSVTSSGHDSYWNAAPTFQNHNVSPQQPQVQQVDPNPTYQTFQDQQKAAYHHGPTVQYPASHQVSQSFPPAQNAPPFDSRRVNALPIPTNPRIAPNLPLGVPKTNKDSSTTLSAAKPAYVSVSLPKANEKVSPGVAADSIKPETFPKSLRGYVERALARCKGDSQVVACQTVMKEIITKATADGTLYTRDWDIEPLFPLPAPDMTNKDNLQPVTPISLLSKNKRSPGRRSKSRWEPVPEEKPVLGTPPASVDTVKYGGGWMHFSGKDAKLFGGKSESKGGLNNMRFQLPESRSGNRTGSNQAKRQRRTDGLGTDSAATDDASSDSDKEQSLTAYYSAAITLADSPEEKKRRENRSKRFDRGPGNRKNSSLRPKNVGAGNLYTRRASALVLSKNFDDGSSRAVEDIDWDALTVKGTCQEIEKRYLRLTSAPDPATVRPEEVLEKALLMVQNSQKNYLYKCDQLKSIRQDLTVQRIRNELTAKVYETHARLAIEVGDLGEINQCQSQLRTLYAEGIKGCHMEFAAYNLLSVILHSNNNRDLLSAMSRLSVDTRKDESVKHALAVRAAVTSGNYVMFFRLYKTAPNLNTCLMDLYVEKMRYKAVTCMSRSYRPTVPVPYIARVLGFNNALPSGETSEDKESEVSEECAEWLKAHGACLVADNNGEMQFDAKASSSTLFMPEPEDAVAHGDASLAVNDFLTRNPSSS